MSEPWEHPLGEIFPDAFATRAWVEEQCRGLTGDVYVPVPVAALRYLLETPGTVTAEIVGQPDLQCAACLQQAADAEAAKMPVPPVHPAATVVQGMAICNVAHRIVAQATAAGALLIPQNGHLPPGFPRAA